jgi:hypothetical protein
MLTVETVLKVRLAKRDGQSKRGIAKKYHLRVLRARRTVLGRSRGPITPPHPLARPCPASAETIMGRPGLHWDHWAAWAGSRSMRDL